MKAACFCLALLAVSTTALADEPFSKMSFDDACKEAKENKKIVVVDFYTTWCGPCKMLDRTTWKDEKVCKWLQKHSIALKIDAEKERKLAARFNVSGYPTILFLKPDGKEIDRLVGYRPANVFLEEAEGALSGKDSVTRAREKLKATGNENNPMERLNLAQALAQKGRYDEALKECLWCFDHGLEHDPAFAGVRLSFLLMNIQQLSQVCPTAMDALRERRQRAEDILLGRKKPKKGNKAQSAMGRNPRFLAAMDFSALNRGFNDKGKTLMAFDQLIEDPKVDQEVLSVLLKDILAQLVEAKRYKDVVRGLPDPVSVVERNVQSYDEVKQHEEANKPPGAPSSLPHFREETLVEGGMIYEALVGAKEPKLARKVAVRMLKFEHSGETYARLLNHAVRAGDMKEAKKVDRRARKKLDDGEYEAVAVAARSIPQE